MRITNDQISIETFLPKFYKKDTQISTILNPLLKNIRESKVSSYSQLQNIKFSSSQIQNQSLSYPLQKSHIFTQKLFHNSFLQPSNSSSKQKNTISSNIPLIGLGSKKLSKFHNKISKEVSQGSKEGGLMAKKKSYSYELRSKTSQESKKYNKMLNGPCTADISVKLQQNNGQRKKLLFEDPEKSFQFLQEQFSKYLQLKISSKGPSITGGKFSKIKKHLVEEINIQEIEKKFYQSPSNMTNYKLFFERILKRRKMSQMTQKAKSRKSCNNVCETIDSSTPVIGQDGGLSKQKYISSEFIRKRLSRTIDPQRQNQISRKVSEDHKRKRSMKAILFYKKNTPNEISHPSDIAICARNLNTIEITGNKKSISLVKK